MALVDRLSAIGPVNLLAVAAAVLISLAWLNAVLLDPLRRIPGPFLARFSRLWLLRQYLKGDYHKTNIRLHEKYGAVVRIAPGQYSIDDFEAAKTIYGHGSHFRKSDWYLPWGHPTQSNLFNEVNPVEHASMRKQVSNLYAMSSLVSYEPYVDQCTSLLCERLSEFAAAGAIVEMRHWFQCYAFDVIGLITFSKRFGNLDRGEDIGDIMAALDKAQVLGSNIGLYPSWFPLVFKLLTRLTQAKDGKLTGQAYVGHFARSEVQSRRDTDPNANGSGVNDFIGKVLNRKTDEGANVISDQVLQVTAGANVAAGSDTTAITLSATLYYLCKYPEVTKKLRAELKECVDLDRESRTLTFQQAQSLPYLQAVIKESLRMHPATGFTMPRVVPSGGCTIAGHFFPAGEVVGINSWVAHHNRTVFGDDADIFRPERWLKTDEGYSSSRMQAYYFTFGQGSRTCIGKNISLLELSKCIPRILEHFDFELVDAGEMECTNSWFVKPNSLRCRVRPRAL